VISRNAEWRSVARGFYHLLALVGISPDNQIRVRPFYVSAFFPRRDPVVHGHL
jgi:hypothetical protein